MSGAMRPPGPPDPPRCPTCGKNYPWMAGVGPDRCACPRPKPSSVSPSEIRRQRELGWPDFHPEDYCHRCGRTNPSWWTDRETWIAATVKWAAETGREGICCPSCLAEMYEARGGPPVLWRFEPVPVDVAGNQPMYNELRARAEAAEARVQDLLQTIVRLTHETPYPEEAEENRQRVGVLVAEVGTLRARADAAEARALAAERERDKAVAHVEMLRGGLDKQRLLTEAAEADVAALRDRVASLEAQVERLKEMEQALCTCRSPDEGDTLCCVHFPKTGVRPRERLDGAYERIVALTKDNERAAAEIETWKGTAREYNELANLQEECVAQAIEGHRKTAEQTATHFSERWRQAHERAEAAEAQVEVTRGALEDVVDYHGHMVHGQDCPIRLCEAGDCEHADEADCEEHADECECCLGVAFVASRALSPDAPKRLLDRLRLAEAVAQLANEARPLIDALVNGPEPGNGNGECSWCFEDVAVHEEDCPILEAEKWVAAYDKQGDAK